MPSFVAVKYDFGGCIPIIENGFFTIISILIKHFYYYIAVI